MPTDLFLKKKETSLLCICIPVVPVTYFIKLCYCIVLVFLYLHVTHHSLAKPFLLKIKERK